MKLLFSHYNFFSSEQSGKGILNVEKKETQELISTEPIKKDLNDLSQKIETEEKQQLSQSVENEKKIKEGIEVGDKIYDDIRHTIAQELPESKARQLTPEVYGQNIDNIGKRFALRISNWNKSYNQIIPNGWQESLKIGAVVGTFGYGSTEGNMMKRLQKASTWAAIAATVTHPKITSGLAIALRTAGEEVIAPVITGTGNLVVSLIDNPEEVWSVLKQTGSKKFQSPGTTPIYKYLATGQTESHDFAYELATGNQNAFELRAKGLEIGDDNLRNVMNEMDSYQDAKELGQSPEFSDRNIKSAATFILQMAEHRLDEKELAMFRVKLWNREAVPSEIRRVLATNAEREMLDFFKEDSSLWSKLQTEMSKQKQSGTPLPEVDLSKMFIDRTASKGAKGFSLSRPKRGIRRFLGMGGAGMALASGVIFFLTISGVMKLQKLAQPDFYKKSIPEKTKRTIKFGAKPLAALSAFLKKNKAKGILTHFQDEKTFTKAEQKLIWKKFSSEEHKILITQSEKFVKREEKEKDGEYEAEQLPEIIRSKLTEIRKEAKEKIAGENK